MDPVQIERCKTITKRIYDLPIANYFREPVNLELTPGYREKVKRPMDLGTILQNLTDKKYTSVDKWKEDIRQIARNSQLFNGDTLITKMAEELVDFAKRKWDDIPKNEWEKWKYRIGKTQKKLADILECRPDPSRTFAEAPKAKPTKLRLKLKNSNDGN